MMGEVIESQRGLYLRIPKESLNTPESHLDEYT